jgi:hypothetical protein
MPFIQEIGRGRMSFPILPQELADAMGSGNTATAYATDPETGKTTFFSSFEEANAFAKARNFELSKEAWNKSFYNAPSPNGLYFVPWQRLKERAYASGGKGIWEGQALVGEGAVAMGEIVAPWDKAFKVVKWIDKAGEAGAALRSTESIATGGRTVTKWRFGAGMVPGEIGGKEAQEAYAAIRSSGTDVAAIVRYQGLSARSQERLVRIKEYLFSNPEFHADPQIASAWNRLRSGAGTEADMLLLKHEAVEMYSASKHGLSQTEAHRRATELFDWASTLDGK